MGANSRLVKYFILLSMIPLILSIGIAPALQFDFLQEAEAAKGQGVDVKKYGSKHGLVCGDKLCSEIEPTAQTSPSSRITPSTPITKAPALETVETRIGTLTLDADYLTDESAKILEDELFFQRAVQVYLLTIPAASAAGVWSNFDEFGAQSGDVVYFSDVNIPSEKALTLNISVLYIWGYMDLSEGPYVYELPAGMYGTVDNLFQIPLTDFGAGGPDKGNGGKYLFLPPNYDGDIPDGYFIVKSDTIQIFYIMRSFVPISGDTSKPVELIKQIKNYHLSQASNPPEQKFVDLGGKPITMVYSDVDGYWEHLHKTLSKETIPRPEDKLLIGLMHTIGIVPGESFNPDEHSKKLLDEAAVVGHLMAIKKAYHTPLKDLILPYDGFSNWIQMMNAENGRFEDVNGIPMIDGRIAYFYIGITMSDEYVKSLVGKGSKYLGTFYDSENNFLDGSNLYSLHVPANVPAERFWSVIVYDTESRIIIDNGLQPQPGIRSLDAEKLNQNSDGSYDLYFGPESPEGFESNWVKTNDGDGFWLGFRFYSPTQEFYDANWKLPNVELVK